MIDDYSHSGSATADSSRRTAGELARLELGAQFVDLRCLLSELGREKFHSLLLSFSFLVRRKLRLRDSREGSADLRRVPLHAIVRHDFAALRVVRPVALRR